MRLDASGSRTLRSCLHFNTRVGKSSWSSIAPCRQYSALPDPELGESSRSHDAVSRPANNVGHLFDKIKHTDVNLINKEPDLAAFDELNPLKGQARSKGSFLNNIASNPEVWKRTFRRVLRSFTFKQLGVLCKEADIPMRVFRKYKIKQIYKASKDTRARMLMVHRFRMIDPAQQSDRLLEKTKQNTSSTLEMPISQIALLLLALGGQKDIQKLLQAQRVKLLPVKVKKDDSLLLILQGSEGGIASVQVWLSSFLERIQSNTQPLSSYSISNLLHPPDDHRLRLISQLSQTVVSLDKSGNNVTIHSVNEKSLATAETMLSQYLYDAQLTQQRIYYSYTSPGDVPIESSTLREAPQYAFVPHVGPSPLPWQSEPGTLGGLFRIAQQIEISPDENIFSKNHQKSSQAVVKSLDVSSDHSESQFENNDFFNNLRGKIDSEKESIGTWSYSADFGHLLFDNLNHSSTSRVLSLVNPPLSGSWPLETGIDWLRKLEKRQVDLSHTPSFCSDLPPLAFSLDAGFISPVGFGATSRSMGDDRYEDSSSTRNNVKWSEELFKLGFPLGLGRTKNELTNIINLSSPTFTESIVITYAGKDGNLIFQVRESKWKLRGDADTSSNFFFVAGEISKVSIADMIVPEASVDLRLSATKSNSISQEDLLKDEGLQKYFDGETGEIIRKEVTAERSEVDGVKFRDETVEESSMRVDERNEIDEKKVKRQSVLPRRVKVKDQDFIFISAKKTDRWEWLLNTDPALHYKGKIIMQRAAAGEKGSFTSSFRIQFKERQQRPDNKASVQKEILRVSPEEAASQTTEVGNTHVSDLQDIEEVKSIEGGKVDETKQEIIEDVEEVKKTSASKLSEIPQWDTMRTYIDIFLARGYRSVRGR